MVASKATPASFAELWEQLGAAHRHELSELRQENFRMRCCLAHTAQEYAWCGTFEDKDSRSITVKAVSDSIVVTFSADPAQLAQGDLNVFGLRGKYEDGFMTWDNGDRWRRTGGAAALAAASLDPLAEEDAAGAEGAAGVPGASPRPAKEGRALRLPLPDGDVDEEEPRGRPEQDGPDPDAPLAFTASGLSKAAGRRHLQRQGSWSSARAAGAVRNFASPRKKEKLPFSKHKTAVQIRETFKCKACVLLEQAVRSPWFEAAVWVLVALSAAGMAAELQYVGSQLGYVLEVDGYVAAAAQQYPGATNAFKVMEWVFGGCFTAYLLLKLSVYRGDFWCGSERLWNICDVLILILWWIWQLDNIGQSKIFHQDLTIHPQLLRVFRLSRLIRHVKMVRQFLTFDSLHVMTTALKGSLHVFVWAVLLLCLFQTILALVLTSTIQEFYLDVDTNDIAKQREVYRYFGTFTRTFLTMFELSLANWPTPSRVLTENISEWWTLFAILHKLTIGFALVGIINGVFMQETFKVAAIDDRIMLRQKQAAAEVHETKMKALFKHLDTSHDGKVDMNEFQQIVRDKQVKDWLAAQDITVTDADGLFKLIAGQDDNQLEITSEELIAGLGRMKGTVRTLDFMLLKQQVLENNDILRKVAGMPRQ